MLQQWNELVESILGADAFVDGKTLGVILATMLVLGIKPAIKCVTHLFRSPKLGEVAQTIDDLLTRISNTQPELTFKLDALTGRLSHDTVVGKKVVLYTGLAEDRSHRSEWKVECDGADLYEVNQISKRERKALLRRAREKAELILALRRTAAANAATDRVKIALGLKKA